MSSSLIAIATAGLEEGPLVTSLIWLVVDPSYLVSIAVVLGCCWMLRCVGICTWFYMVLECHWSYVG